jgi:hypothetical protein
MNRSDKSDVRKEKKEELPSEREKERDSKSSSKCNVSGRVDELSTARERAKARKTGTLELIFHNLKIVK